MADPFGESPPIEAYADELGLPKSSAVVKLVHDRPPEPPSAPLWPPALDLEALAEIEPERPKFLMEDWLPCGYATLLAGHGGTGKSQIALMLAVCIAAGVPFYGKTVERRRACYLSCEDRADILHWRLRRICDYLGIGMASLRGWLEVIDLVDHDTVLWARDPKTGYTLTMAAAELARRFKENETEVLFVDGIADTFDGNESAKADVKRFVKLLVSNIPADRGAVLLIGHIAKPTASGVPTTEGYSGTTGWHNSVRARWYLYPEMEKAEEGGAQKTGSLVLELQKSNLGRVDQSMRFTWDPARHLFTGAGVAESTFDRRHQEREEHAGILNALAACQATTPSTIVPATNGGQRTAWHVLSVRDEFPKTLKSAADKNRFRRHIEVLKQGGQIKVVEYVKADRKPGEKLVLP